VVEQEDVFWNTFFQYIFKWEPDLRKIYKVEENDEKILITLL